MRTQALIYTCLNNYTKCEWDVSKFDPEGKGSMFTHKNGIYLHDYMVSQPKDHNLNFILEYMHSNSNLASPSQM